MQLTKLRQKRGMTQQNLADLVGVSRALISMVEIGNIKPYPSLKKRISKALEVSEQRIFR